jgi:ankyrin repeat protein
MRGSAAALFNTKDNEGKTPAHHAAENGHADSLRIVRESSCDTPLLLLLLLPPVIHASILADPLVARTLPRAYQTGWHVIVLNGTLQRPFPCHALWGHFETKTFCRQKHQSRYRKSMSTPYVSTQRM